MPLWWPKDDYQQITSLGYSLSSLGFDLHEKWEKVTPMHDRLREAWNPGLPGYESGPAYEALVLSDYAQQLLGGTAAAVHDAMYGPGPLAGDTIGSYGSLLSKTYWKVHDQQEQLAAAGDSLDEVLAKARITDPDGSRFVASNAHAAHAATVRRIEQENQDLKTAFEGEVGRLAEELGRWKDGLAGRPERPNLPHPPGTDRIDIDPDGVKYVGTDYTGIATEVDTRIDGAKLTDGRQPKEEKIAQAYTEFVGLLLKRGKEAGKELQQLGSLLTQVGTLYQQGDSDALRTFHEGVDANEPK